MVNVFKKRTTHLVIIIVILVVVVIPNIGTKEPILEKGTHASNYVETSLDGVRGAVEDDSWRTILVNPWNSIDKNYRVDLINIGNGHKVDQRIYSDLNKMITAAKDEGLSLHICSSYRDFNRQGELYENKIKRCIEEDGLNKKDAVIEAKKWVAVPGTSEHQLGLALDIVSESYQLLDESQEDTKEQKWLIENSYKFGFILRYPNDKSSITGIGYEPWHYRYVGRDIAEFITRNKITLEEYTLLKESEL